MDMITLALAKAHTDEKCGSGGGFPVVEITTELRHTESGLPLSDAECDALDAAAETNLPIVLMLYGGMASGVCVHQFDGDAHVYFLNLSLDGSSFIYLVDLRPNGGRWAAHVNENF